MDLDLQKVQVNKRSYQMKSLKNQYSTVNSSMVTLYSKQKSPHNYHTRALQESNFIFQQGKSCMSKTITIFKYRKRHKPYVFKGDSSVFCMTNKNLEIMRKYSMPTLRNILCFTTLNSKSKSIDKIMSRKTNSFKRNYTVNVISGAEHSYYFRNSFLKPNYKIYRCQFNKQEESCCCSCNSDAMFEVMKSLYDCYKKKNCDHCNCILCGHLPREERQLAELRKSAGIIKVSKNEMKERRKTKAKKNKDVPSHLKGKSAAENEKILEDLVASEVHLPKGRTTSKKELTQKVKARRKLSEEGHVPEAEAIISMKKIPSAKLRKAKEAGLFTPLEGKTAKQKENILRGFAMNGIPLPTGKTASDKKLIKKVIEEMGLPPQPKTSSAEERYQKAIKAGLVTPLEGKSTPEKEKILKDLAKLGVELPVGRTASEKSLIAKVKASAPIPTEVGVKPAKASGLVSLFHEKSPEQTEKILTNLAMRNVPLPEGKTPSEKILINKVRTDVGLPPEAKSESEKEKYRQAEAAGLIVPLKGKTPAEKEKILKAQADFGLPLLEGRTPSEKSLIKKIKRSKKKRIKSREKSGDSPALPLDKRKKLNAKTLKVMKEGKGPSDECICGLLTPEEERISRVSTILSPLKKKTMKDEIAKSSNLLHEITPSEKEKILRNIAKQGFPLPEPKTSSEKAIIEKVRHDLGLPPQPKTLEIKKPLANKTPSQKEKLLKKMYEAGIQSPKAKTSSEKSLKKKVTKEPNKGKMPSEKYGEAKAKGLLTSLDGKTPAQKEKKFRELAKSGLPLPAGKTPSEKALIHKIQAKESIVPTRPSTSTRPFLPPDKLKKMDKSTAKGMKESKGPSDECICNLLMSESKREKLISLMPAHKKLSQTISSSEKNRKAKAAGLLTPLKGKTPEQKEKILKRLAMQKIPLPHPKTASEKKIFDKVRASIGLPPEPKTSSEKLKYKKAITAGLVTPLQGKSEIQKEKILRGQKEIGLKLPEPRTPSEKALIQKIQETIPSLKYVHSEKIRKSKAPELVVLEGKTPEQKEKILKGLALKGIPLPEPKTSSEKKIINKVRTEIGLPPVPKTSSLKEKYNKAKAEGLITPLHGKSAAQKEKVLRGQAQMGLPLPEGRTASEKALIAKIKATPAMEVPKVSKSFEKIGRLKVTKLDKKTAKVMKEGKGPSDDCICGILTPESEKVPTGAPSITAPKQSEIFKAPFKKIRRAKAAGLMTPLKGKTPEQKEKILKELAMQGIPLTEAKTASEKKLIEKVRNEVGLPPEPKTPSMKLKYNKAIADDVIVPLEGKTNEQKEKTLRNQAALGIPLAVGRTASEKAIIDKIKESIPPEKMKKANTTSGLLTPLEVEPISEKGKMKKKSKIFGASGVRRSVKRVGLTKSKGGIVEEFQDIIKTTTCDRGCGCDKKKIRFKHSYVKIRVTSPDISSLCPCPEECVPGVKRGVFTDNEGIKVTVGRVMCFSSNSLRRQYQHENSSSLAFVPFNILLNEKNTNNNGLKNISKSETEIYLQKLFKQNQRLSNGFITNEFNGKVNKIDTFNLFFKSEESLSSLHYDYSSNISNSFDSINFIKTNSSLSLITIPSIASMWSFSTTSISINSSLDKQSFIEYDINNYENFSSLVLKDTHSKISSISLDVIKKNLLEFPMYRENNLDNDIQIIYRASDVNKEILLDNQNHDNYVDCVDKISNKDEILQVFSRISSKTQLKNSSSIIIIVASSSDSCSTSNTSSTICLEISEDRPNWNPGTSGLHHVHQKQKGFKITKRKNLRHVIKTDSSHIRVLTKTHKVKKSHTTQFNQEYDVCQPSSGWNKLNIISTDTTEDIPCFSNVIIAKNVANNKTTQEIDNIVSEFVKPMILEEVVAQGLYHDLYKLDLALANSIEPSNHCKTTSVRLCKIPSCSGYQSCHSAKSPYTKTLKHIPQPNNYRNPNLYKSCDCTPTKLKEIFEKNTIQLISKACGDSKEELRKKHVKLGYELDRTPYVIATQNNKCCSCNSPKLNLQSCINSDDKTKKHLCPCEQPHKISNSNNYGKEFNYKTEDSNLKNKWCEDQTRLKSKKNIICECPKEPEPEIEIDGNEWLEETQLRKIQSDLTQTTSGFKIKIQKKPSDLELSFEEVLRYFAENLENDNINEEICDCNDKSKKAKLARCECPYEPYDIQSTEEKPPTMKKRFTGIKFHIDGKGTASKGLSGILCFE